MVDAMLIDLKALMVEREDCDAGTVEKLKNGLAQGKTQYKTLRDSTEPLRKKGEGALANFYLGKAYLERQELDEAMKAFDKAEKSGYTASQVQLQKAGIHRLQGHIDQSRALLNKLEDQASHNAEYHFQVAANHRAEGRRDQAVKHFERAAELDPGHTGALFQLAFANDLDGNDDEAIGHYEKCLNHPPIHV